MATVLDEPTAPEQATVLTGPDAGPPPNPEPGDALALRVISDWAGGTRGSDPSSALSFTCSVGNSWTAEPGQTTFPAVISPPNARTTHAVTSLTLTLAAAGVTGESHSVTLWAPQMIGADPALLADALLWSEGAVEKFLLPYITSMGGWTTPGLVADVLKAWFEYDGTRVQVLALAYTLGSRAPAPDTPLSVRGSLSVVYAPYDQGQPQGLEVRPLEEFLAMTEFFASSTQGAPQGPQFAAGTLGTLGMTPGEQITNVVARELAEFACGIRGQGLYLVTDAEADPPQLSVNACPGAARCVTEEIQALFTGHVRPDRPRPTTVSINVQDALEPLPLVGPGIAAPPDAFFWTDAAIERLVIPYYASVKGIQSPLFLAHLVGMWIGAITPGVPVTLEEIFHALGDLDAQTVDGDAPLESDVYGLIHLPRSEYIPEESLTSITLDRRLELLSFDGTQFRRTPATPRWRGEGAGTIQRG